MCVGIIYICRVCTIPCRLVPDDICVKLSNCIYIFIVSKTTRELLLLWHESSPVDLSSDLKMPQFTVEEVVTDKCEESSMIGKYKNTFK